jgi:hypothetical protein
MSSINRARARQSTVIDVKRCKYTTKNSRGKFFGQKNTPAGMGGGGAPLWLLRLQN